MIIISLLNSKVILIYPFLNHLFFNTIQSRKNSRSWGEGILSPP